MKGLGDRERRLPSHGFVRMCRAIAAAIAMTVLVGCAGQEPQAIASSPELGFEVDVEEGQHLPPGWSSAPPETVSIARDFVAAGTASVRIHRDSASQDSFSMIARRLSAPNEGGWVEFSGMLKTQAVEGSAALWFRQDGEGETLQFDNMSGRGLRGDAEWQRVSIRQRLDPKASKLVFGALLSGTGTLWVDELELTINGAPVSFGSVADPPGNSAGRHGKTQRPQASGVKVAEITDDQAAGLALLGRVWGFLKYYHPEVRAGARDWDAELLQQIPAHLSAVDANARRELLREWISGLGEVAQCVECASLPADVHLAAPLDWLEDTRLLGESLSADLRSIRDYRPSDGQHHYVAFADQVGNAMFEGESSYASASLDDSGFRLLALFRYWAAVEYWFPYRNLVPSDWEASLPTRIQSVLRAPDAARYRLEMARTIAAVGDGHARLWSAHDVLPPTGACRIPVGLRFVENKLVVVEAADAEANLERGDVIAEIDGRPVSSLTKELEPFYPGSNESAKRKLISLTIPRGDCGPVRLGIRRGTGELQVISRRTEGDLIQPRHDLPGDALQRLDDGIAYLKLSAAKVSAVPDYLRELRESRALVIDIRNYPSDFIVFALGSHLVNRDTPFARFTVPSADSPGTFSFTAPMILPAKPPHYGKPIAILVDEASMSQSEYTAMAFRSAPNAVVVGSTTAGADGNVSVIPLPGGLQAAMSGIGVFYPDKRETQVVGIIPDLHVGPTVEGVRAGRDEVLQAALENLRKRMAVE